MTATGFPGATGLNLGALLMSIDADPRYGAIGAPYRRHGRCTCRNNRGWPGCSICQDMFRCHGCRTCDPYYVNDCADETHKGKPHCCRKCATCDSGGFCGRDYYGREVAK